MTFKNTSSTTNLCVFCYNIIPPEYYNNQNAAEISKFSANLFRLLNIQPRPSIPSSSFGSCKDCESLITQFSDLYHQMKCLELHLFSKLETIENVIKSADNLDSRKEFIKHCFEKGHNDNSSSKGCTGYPAFDAFRTIIKKRCEHGRNFTRHQPRVLLNRSSVTDSSQRLTIHTKDNNFAEIKQNVLPNDLEYKTETREHEEDYCPKVGNDFEYIIPDLCDSSLVPNNITDSTNEGNVNSQIIKTEIDSSAVSSDTGFVHHQMFDIHQENSKSTSNVEHLHICPHCRTAFQKQSVLIQHMEFHKNPNEWKFECSHCGKKCANNHNLKAHLASHSEIRPFKCEKCGKSYKLRNVLKRHMESHKNPEEWRHQCSICGKRCANKHNLTKHILVHSNEHPWKCQQCGKGLKSKERLKKHMEYHKNPEDLKHRCVTCGKPFVNKNQLTRHMEIHLGEKRWHCKTCGDMFGSKSGWRRHALKKHGQRETQA